MNNNVTNKEQNAAISFISKCIGYNVFYAYHIIFVELPTIVAYG